MQKLTMASTFHVPVVCRILAKFHTSGIRFLLVCVYFLLNLEAIREEIMPSSHHFFGVSELQRRQYSRHVRVLREVVEFLPSPFKRHSGIVCYS